MPIVMRPDTPSLPTEMLRTWISSVAAFLLSGAVLMRARYRYAVLSKAADAADPGGRR